MMIATMVSIVVGLVDCFFSDLQVVVAQNPQFGHDVGLLWDSSHSGQITVGWCGLPQWGQLSALSDICLEHSEH